VGASRGQRERPAREQPFHAVSRIEGLEQGHEVVLVGTTAVHEHQRAEWLAPRRAAHVGERVEAVAGCRHVTAATMTTYWIAAAAMTSAWKSSW
jgi:hypothetical protein